VSKHETMIFETMDLAKGM